MNRTLAFESVQHLLGMPDILGPQTSMTRSGRNSPHYFFVDGENGNNGHGGRKSDSPLATIQAAINACVSGRGDVIFVRPGSYDENLVVLDKDYVTIVAAMQNGYARPDVVPSAGIALDVQDSQGFQSLGIRYVSEDSDVVRVEGNGFHFDDCVFDGTAGMAATEALMRLWGSNEDDSYTSSEGKIIDCLFRGSNGKGLVFDCQDAFATGVLPTDNVIDNCRFYDNVAEDVFVAATAVAVNGLHRTVFKHCLFGGGSSKNKATHIDLKTNKIATPDTEFIDCFVNDDTIDTTAVKTDGIGTSWIGCYSLDGVINGDTLD